MQQALARKFVLGLLVVATAFGLTVATSGCSSSSSDSGGSASTTEPAAEKPAEPKPEEPVYSSWIVNIVDDATSSKDGMTYTIALNFNAENPTSDISGKYSGSATAKTTTKGSAGGASVNASAIAKSSQLEFTLAPVGAGSELKPLTDEPGYIGKGTITMAAAGDASVGSVKRGISNTSSQPIEVLVSGVGRDARHHHQRKQVQVQGHDRRQGVAACPPSSRPHSDRRRMRALPSGHLDKRVITSWRLSRGVWTAIIGLLLVAAATGGPILLQGALSLPWILAAVGLSAFIVIVFVVIVPSVRYRTWLYEVTDDEIDIRKGVVVHTRIIVPLVRVQHVNTSQGPILRAFGLASVSVATAAGELEIPGLSVEEADKLRDRVAVLARLAQEDV